MNLRLETIMWTPRENSEKKTEILDTLDNLGKLAFMVPFYKELFFSKTFQTSQVRSNPPHLLRCRFGHCFRWVHGWVLSFFAAGNVRSCRAAKWKAKPNGKIKWNQIQSFSHEKAAKWKAKPNGKIKWNQIQSFSHENTQSIYHIFMYI